MIFRSRHFSISIGYQIETDAWGITLGLGERIGAGRYECKHRLVVSASWLWPHIRWAHEKWAIDEKGYIRGHPVHRPGIASSAWTGRKFRVYSWEWFRQFSIIRHDDVPADHAALRNL